MTVAMSLTRPVPVCPTSLAPAAPALPAAPAIARRILPRVGRAVASAPAGMTARFGSVGVAPLATAFAALGSAGG